MMPSTAPLGEMTRRTTRTRKAYSKPTDTVVSSDNSSDEEMQQEYEDIEEDSSSDLGSVEKADESLKGSTRQRRSKIATSKDNQGSASSMSVLCKI